LLRSFNRSTKFDVLSDLDTKRPALKDGSPFAIKRGQKTAIKRVPFCYQTGHEFGPFSDRGAARQGSLGSTLRSWQVGLSMVQAGNINSPRTPMDTMHMSTIATCHCRWFKLATLNRGGVLWRPPDADAGRAFCSTWVACQGRHPCQVALSSVKDSDAGWSFVTLVRRESLHLPDADARRAFCSTRVACQGRHPCQVVLSSVDDSDAGLTRVCCIFQLVGDGRSVQHEPPAKEIILVESSRLLSSVDDSDAGSNPSGDLLMPREDTPTNPVQ
jgi:hypothetical protein